MDLEQHVTAWTVHLHLSDREGLADAADVPDLEAGLRAPSAPET